MCGFVCVCVMQMGRSVGVEACVCARDRVLSCVHGL